MVREAARVTRSILTAALGALLGIGSHRIELVCKLSKQIIG